MTVQAGSPSRSDHGSVALVPRVNIQAFWETQQTAESITNAFADRRMARAHGTVLTGGISSAISHYQTQSTPNLLLIESGSPREQLLASLAALADVCQPETKVVIIGQMNDVILYRELIRQGISEYLVAPVAPLQLIETIAALYRSEKAAPIGRVIAFIGARGGTGSSVLSHNLAWEFARATDAETTLIDLDLAYGTAALDFNLDASGGIMEAITQPERIDALLLDRLLAKLGGKLSLLGGPGGVDKDFAIDTHAIEKIFTAMRTSVPLIAVDLPHIWAPWIKFALLHADQVVITTEPELASLRNTRAIVDMLKAARPNDSPPTIVLNQVGVPKRPEIAGADFRNAIGIDIAAVVPFDPQNFGTALNNGKMLLEMAPRARAAEVLRNLARDLVGEKAIKPAAGSTSLLKKLLSVRKT